LYKEVPGKHGTEDENAKRFASLALLEGKFPPQHQKKKHRGFTYDNPKEEEEAPQQQQQS
jgi:hypothetical protein